MFCSICNSIQSVASEDYFSYLGIDRRWSVDELDLKARYRQLQSKVHPDKFRYSCVLWKKKITGQKGKVWSWERKNKEKKEGKERVEKL